MRRSLSAESSRLGFGLAEALRGEAQEPCEFGCADAADEVAVFAPQVQGAAVVLGGERVLGRAHVEEHLAVFEEHGCGVLGEEGFERCGDLAGRLVGFRGSALGGGASVIGALPAFAARRWVMCARWWRQCQA